MHKNLSPVIICDVFLVGDMIEASFRLNGRMYYSGSNRRLGLRHFGLTTSQFMYICWDNITILTEK